MQLHPRVSVNGVSSWNWTLEQDVEFWAANQITRVTVPVSKMDQVGHDAAKAMLQKNDLSVSHLILPSAFDLGDPRKWEQQSHRLCSLVDLAGQLDAGCVYITTGPSASGTTVDESVAAFLEAIAPVQRYAATTSVRLAVEHNHTMSHDMGCIHSLRDAIAVASPAGLGIIVEFAGCWLERDLPSIFADGVKLFDLVQVNDFVVGTATRMSRACPGDGDIPIKKLVAALLDSGYQGLFDIEILGPRIEEEGYPSAITRSARWLSDCLHSLGA